jgi:hypothetical protein
MSQQPKQPKSIWMKVAMEKMRTGARLCKMHAPNLPHGYGYFVCPGGYVTNAKAKAIQDRPDVWPGKDGLFPWFSQTWRMGV